jgi:hypothetical protein
MSKYYTPTIEEFHVGFEYEYQDMLPSGGAVDWVKDTFKANDNLESILESNDWYDLPRVKYLDREDIESFGFTDYKKAVCAWYKLEGKWEDSFCTYGYWTKLRLLHCARENESGIKIMAYEHSFSEEETILFQGQIKNKSELKRLLKQLKIIE